MAGVIRTSARARLRRGARFVVMAISSGTGMLYPLSPLAGAVRSPPTSAGAAVMMQKSATTGPERPSTPIMTPSGTLSTYLTVCSSRTRSPTNR